LKAELVDFLLEQCRERGLSVRKLSLNAGLSPATIHNIIHRKYEPKVNTLNRIADYLGVDREFLWKLAGLTGGETSSLEATIDDPRVRLRLEQISRLPKDVRDRLFSVIDVLISLFARED
jgi:lambda repressor-like predicted transcriptional regulator